MQFNVNLKRAALFDVRFTTSSNMSKRLHGRSQHSEAFDPRAIDVFAHQITLTERVSNVCVTADATHTLLPTQTHTEANDEERARPRVKESVSLHLWPAFIHMEIGPGKFTFKLLNGD